MVSGSKRRRLKMQSEVSHAQNDLQNASQSSQCEIIMRSSFCSEQIK